MPIADPANPDYWFAVGGRRTIGPMTRFAPKAAVDRGAAASIDDALIGYARSLWGAAAGYAEPPERITGGFDTTIYGFRLSGVAGQLAQPLIVRIFGAGEGHRAQFEGAVQNALAGIGYPVPRVIAVSTDTDVLGGAFTIMQRMPGRVMLSALLGPRMLGTSATLGRLHARLHAIDPEMLERALADAGMPPSGWIGGYDRGWMRGEMEKARLDGLRDGMEWLESNVPPAPARLAICHGDFHPLNVLLDGRHVSGVLDWAMTQIADPAWDVGATMALFGHGPVDLPGPLLRVVGMLRGAMLRRYVKAYAETMPLDMGAVRYYEAFRLWLFLMEGGQHRQSMGGVIPPPSKPTAFHAKAVLDGIARRFTEITSVAVALPPETKAAN
jgi:aminoglycoside phosphotransferase (APT) family kinase protein